MVQSLTMKAARFHGKGDIRIEEIPVPGPPKSGEIKVSIFAGGICGSDLHEYIAGPVLAGTHAHPLTNEKMPVTLGHEFSGTIQDLGESVDTSKYRIGDKVAVYPIISCGKCNSCLKNEFHICEKVGFIGINGLGGGLSSQICVPQHMVYVLPKNVSLESGALVEPLSVAWHAVKKSGVGSGSKAIIFGAGPIGCFILSVLKAKGVEWVAVVEIAQKRVEMAKSIGADLVIDPLKEDVDQVCKEATGGKGIDVSFDAAGHENTINTAIRVVRPKGTIVNVAVWEKHPKIDLNALLMPEKHLTAALAYDREDFDEVIEALAEGKIVAENFITRRISLQDAVEKGFDTLVNEKDQHIKILISPEETK